VTRAPKIRYVTEGLINASLVAPAPGAEEGATAVGGGGAGRARDLFARAISAPEEGPKIPPLLRSFAAELGVRLARTFPLPQAAPAPLRERLSQVKADSLGALLEQDPDWLLGNVLRGEYAPALAELLEQAESSVVRISKAMANALSGPRGRPIISRSDLSAAETRKGLVKTLRAQLGDQGPPSTVIDGLLLELTKPTA
jgi:hypothetical protein